MVVTDAIADFLVRIKNASERRKNEVDIPYSKIKEEMLKIMQREGFISGYKKIEDGKQGILRVTLKYKNGIPVFRGCKRISKPGRRIYVTKKEIPVVYKGTGIAIISTSKGILTDKEAREMQIGGEVLCFLW